MNTPGWLAYIGERGVHDAFSAKAYFHDKLVPTATAPDRGPYAIVRADTEQPIGTIGLYERPTLDVPDLGYALLPSAEGFGYAREASEAMLAFAEGKHQGRAAIAPLRIGAITVPVNTASVRVLERLGFTFQRPVILPHSDETLHYYEWCAIDS